MRLSSSVAACAAAFATLIVATSAQAAVMVATYSGYVTYSADFAGVFGAANTDLVGERFTAVFRYDTTVSRNDYGTVRSVDGGVAFGSASPMLDSRITITGTTRHVEGAAQGMAYYDQGIHVQHSSSDDGPLGVSIISMGVRPVNAPSLLETPFEAGAPLGGRIGGGAIYFRAAPGAPDTLIGVAVEHASVTAVPEPATWALMIGGFGLAGAGLRRRRVAITL